MRENVLLIQSNHQIHHHFFAVSSLHALRLLCGCCLVVIRRSCSAAAATADVRCCHCAQQSKEDMEGLVSTWQTSLASRSAGPACQQELEKGTLETFKLRDYQTDQPHWHNPDRAIKSLEGFQQMIVIQCITANIAQIMTWRFTREDLAE